MSAFTETALVKKLLELNPTQQSIQTLSLWLIHHRKHHVAIVRTWFKELQKIQQDKKLTYMYLANDVIQNSKKKGPEYGKEFGKILLDAFNHIYDTCKSDGKIIGSLGRILKIWEERGVYEGAAMKDFKEALRLAGSDKSNSDKNEEKKRNESKRRAEEKSKSDKKESDESRSKKHKSSTSSSSVRERVKSETIEVNGTIETHVTLSPHIPTGDPPEPEELIKMLNVLENSASSDAVVRERIANLPPEVSEIALLGKLDDKESGGKLVIQVNEAVELLRDYNQSLVTEMENRKKLTVMLKDFHTEQQELLVQAEQRLEEYNNKLHKVREVQKEIRNHLKNLPDLTQLPDVTGGLAPLPSAGDLFNIH